MLPNCFGPTSIDSRSHGFWMHGFLNGAVASAIAALSMAWLSSRWKWRFFLPESERSRDFQVDETKEDSRSIRDDTQAPIYLDNNGTTPVYAAVLEAMLPYFQAHYGNPGSAHSLGDVPKRAVQTARRQILTHLLGCVVKESECDNDKSEPNATTVVPESACVFTACGTESNNLAIHWALLKYNSVNTNVATSVMPHIVTSNVEHPAIDACLSVHEQAGRCTVTRVPVQSNGQVTARDMITAIQPHTALVTLMLANNETGALQPIRQVSEYCRSKGVLFATDAAQAVGKISVRLDDLGHPDLVTIVGHKFGAPKGIACLYVRPGCLDGANSSTTGLLVGGGQEWGRRAGTENVPYIVGMGQAAELCTRELDRTAQHLQDMRSLLVSRLQAELGGPAKLQIHGPIEAQERLPNTLSVALLGCDTSDHGRDESQSGDSSAAACSRPIRASLLLDAIRHNVAASAGAACHSAGPVSAVLRALHLTDDVARATVRFSVGPSTTSKEIHCAARIIAQEVHRQQQQESKPS